MPKISVIMSVYNEQENLQESIGSILNQSFKDFEFIIINDGSIDKSLEILNQYTDKRIKVFNKKNSGLPASLNFGFSKSQGDYIARMDADDFSHRDRLKIQNDFLDKNQSIDLVGSNIRIIDENQNIIGFKKVPESSKEISKSLIYTCPIMHPTYLFRKSIFNKVEGYREEFIYAQDYDFLLRLSLKNVNFYNIQEYLLDYKIYKNLRINKKFNQMRFSKLAKKLHKQRLKEGKENRRTYDQVKVLNNLNPIYSLMINLFFYFNENSENGSFIKKLLFKVLKYKFGFLSPTISRTLIDDLIFYKFIKGK
tara:strand:- start:24494 stop:25420 length:927 start_codon:yes stop_codon:yes gene_type:complete